MGHTELYDTLGVPPSASPEEIKKAFRKKAIECHPDKHAGNKDMEERFKKINEAYTVLGDPQKRQAYDQFGVTDNGPGGGGPGPDIGDILKGMFGGMPGMGGMGGMPGMGGMGPGGFSFVFMDGDGPEEGFHDHIFGGPGRGRAVDVVDIPVDVCDVFYGKTKKVEFELLDLCKGCGGTGAADPSAVIKCLTCHGKGSMTQQVGPFFAQTIRCHSCAGAGTTIKNGKICQVCKAKKTVYSKRAFELKIPKGLPNGHEIRMEEKGAYDERIKRNKDMVFRFTYDIKPPYEVDGEGRVTYTLKVPLEDLLAGFERTVRLYNDDHTLVADHYINPNTPITVPGMGMWNARRGKHMDMAIRIVPEYADSDRLVKYNDVIRKVFKKQKDKEGMTPPPPNVKTIKLH